MSRPAKFLAWAIETFGPIAADRHERAARFLEEAIELAQVEGLSGDMVIAIASRVYHRKPGELSKEIGQCLMTLECLAANVMVDADYEANREFDRLLSLPPDDLRKRHAAKVAMGIAGK